MRQGRLAVRLDRGRYLRERSAVAWGREVALPRPLHGFTLVELLVVITIIAILIAILLPAVQVTRESARQLQCSNNLKQLALGVHNYNDTYGCFTPGALPGTFGTSVCPGGTHSNACVKQPSWLWRIMPYIEQKAVYDQTTNIGTDWTGQNGIDYNALVKHQVRMTLFVCPSETMAKTRQDSVQTITQNALTPTPPATINVMLADYAGIAGTYYSVKDMSSAPTPNAGGYGGGRSTFNGVIATIGTALPSPVTFGDIGDGTSNTLCIAEESSSYVDPTTGTQTDCRASNWAGGAWSNGNGGDSDWWLNVTVVRYPINWNGAVNSDHCRYQRHTIIRSSHPEGAYFALADGSVRLVKQTVDFRTLTALCDRNDGQVLSSY